MGIAIFRRTTHLVVWTSMAIGGFQPLLAADTYPLQTEYRPGRLTHVRARIEVGGDLKVLRDNKPQTIPMSVTGQLVYDERLLPAVPGSSDRSRSVRHYDLAEAQIEIDAARSTSKLAEDRRLIGVETGAEDATLFSPSGPLVSDELDLIELPGNTLLLEKLLPNKEVEIGSTWKHDSQLLALLLNLDAVGASEVQSKLVDVKDGTASVELSGTLTGAVGGIATTEIELKARYSFDVEGQLITWFAMLIKENRAIGLVGPGLDVVAKLTVEIAPRQQSPELTDAVLADLNLDASRAMSELVHEVPNQFRVLHDRRWHVTNQNTNLLVLRRVDRGEMVAQCNVTSLTNAPAKDVTMGEFQADIQRVLKDNFGAFTAASESTIGEGLRMLRAEAIGKVSDVPIQWNYYLLSDGRGRRATFVFTMEGSAAERLNEADRKLVESFEFIESAAGSAGTPKPAAVR